MQSYSRKEYSFLFKIVENQFWLEKVVAIFAEIGSEQELLASCVEYGMRLADANIAMAKHNRRGSGGGRLGDWGWVTEVTPGGAN